MWPDDAAAVTTLHITYYFTRSGQGAGLSQPAHHSDMSTNSVAHEGRRCLRALCEAIQ